MSPPKEHVEDTSRTFIAFLERLAPKDADRGHDGSRKRAVLATLRRGLGKPAGSVVDMYRYIGSYLPIEPGREEAYFLVAALFALHPHSWPEPEEGGSRTINRNLGESYKLLSLGDGAAGSTEKRFTALLDASVEALPDHLRHAISLLRSKDVPVNYLSLLHDVQHWTDENRRVQRNWARAYWGGKPAVRPATGETESVATVVVADDEEA